MKKPNICKQKIINNVKNNKLLFIIFMIIWIAVAGITLDKYSPSLGMHSSGNEYLASQVFELDKNTTIEETVSLNHDENSVSIMFATFARNNIGNINVKVVGIRTHKTYLNKTISVDEVLDNAFMTFGLDEKIESSKENKIKVILTSDSEVDTCVGVYYTEKALEDSSFTNNGEEVDGDLKIRFLREDDVLGKFNTKVLTWTIFGLTIIILTIIFSNKEELTFGVMTLIFGLIFMIIITPMSPPDEQKHYEYSYQLSSYIMGQGDDHMLIERGYQDYTHFAGHMNVSDTYEAFEEEINKEYEHTDKYEIITEDNDINEATYYLCYIPQAIAITICRLLSLNFYRLYYAGRLFNLLFYVACVYFAIKKTPIHKTLFGIIATMPIFIQQAASYSYDSFLNGLMLVIAAFLFNWLFEEEKQISYKEVIELLIVILFAAPLKCVYSLFVLCFVFVPYERFGSKKKKTISLLILILPIVILLANLFIPYIAKLFRNLKEENEASYQINMAYNVISTDNEIVIEEIVAENSVPRGYAISDIVRELPQVIALYIHTIRSCIKIWFYESLGRSLSGVSLIVPLKLSQLMAVIVLLAAIVKEKFVLPIKIRISFVVISVAIGLFAMTGMLLSWTAYGAEIIQGIQGRYFCPLLFFIMTILNNSKIYLPTKANKYLMFVQVLMMFETIVYVLSYTFVN